MMTFMKAWEIEPTVDSSFDRIWQHYQSGRMFALLTAFRGDLPLKENRRRNQELASEIRRAGYGYFFVSGYWKEEGIGEVEEDSIFVVGETTEDVNKEREFLRLMVESGRKYDQDGVLVRTSQGIAVYDKSGKKAFELSSFHPDTLNQAYAKMRQDKVPGFTSLRKRGQSGPSFYFESIRLPRGFWGRYSQYLKENNN